MYPFNTRSHVQLFICTAQESRGSRWISFKMLIFASPNEKKLLFMYYVILMSATFSRYIFLRTFFNFLKHSTWCVAMLSIIPGWVHSEFVGAQSRCHLKETKSRWIIFSRKDFFWREGDFLATTTTCIIESVSCWYVYEIIRIICIPRVMARAKRDHSYGSVIKKNIFASIRSQL